MSTTPKPDRLNDVIWELMSEIKRIEHNSGTQERGGKYAQAHQQAHAAITALMGETQTNAVAWVIGIIDELHSKPTGEWSLDMEYKGIKNTIRDRYKAEIGVDPAPNYPIHAILTKKEKPQ